MTAPSMHMPFVLPYGGKPYLLFCLSFDKMTWLSHYMPLDGSDTFRPLKYWPERHASECSPDGFVVDQTLYLSITENFELKLYRGVLEQVELYRSFGPCAAGTVTPTHILIARAGEPRIEVRDYSNMVVGVWSFDELGLSPGASVTRITFLAEDPDKIILTAVGGGEPVSIMVSLDTRRRWRVTSRGAPVYKCALYRDTLYYAAMSGPQFDDRYLVATADYLLIPF